jgi:hypothetical protein
MNLLKAKAIKLTENQLYSGIFDTHFKQHFFVLSDPQHFSLQNKLRQLKNILKNMLSRVKEMAHF